MKKPFKIICSYCCFLIIYTIAFLAFADSAVKTLNDDTDLRPGDPTYYFSLEKRIERYKSDPRPIILGTCYAEAIGESEQLANLSLNGIRFKEASWLLNNCSESDMVILVFSLRDIATPYIVAHRTARFGIIRRGLIYHDFLQNKLGLNINPSQSEVGADYKTHYQNIEQQRQIIRQYLNLEEFPLLALDQFVPYVKGLSRITKMDISLEPLLELRRQHSNIVFVLSPTLSFSRMENTGFGSDLNHYMELRERLLNMLMVSNLHFIDLSDILSTDVFYDCFHYTRAVAQTKVRKQIEDAVTILPKNLPQLQSPDRLNLVQYEEL